MLLLDLWRLHMAIRPVHQTKNEAASKGDALVQGLLELCRLQMLLRRLFHATRPTLHVVELWQLRQQHGERGTVAASHVLEVRQLHVVELWQLLQQHGQRGRTALRKRVQRAGTEML
jgi:hypothetical protein